MRDRWLTAPATRLYLLRHGLTVHTAERRFSGRNDLGLTESGKTQMVATAARLAASGSITAVVSSPLRRARCSAQVVADALQLRVDVDHDLTELDFGLFEGLTWVEAQSAYPDELRAFMDAADVAPPGGESMVGVRARMDRLLTRILGEYQGRTVAVVSHVTPIKVLLCRALDVPLSTVHRLLIAPASLSIIEWYGDGSARVTLMNDTHHWQGR